MIAGKMSVVLVPQGTLIERIGAGGTDLAGAYAHRGWLVVLRSGSAPIKLISSAARTKIARPGPTPSQS
jgi:acyl CoA:acetate/3-ketoacid CoA transferase alpha subunit